MAGRAVFDAREPGLRPLLVAARTAAPLNTLGPVVQRAQAASRVTFTIDTAADEGVAILPATAVCGKQNCLDYDPKGDRLISFH